jgi:uncharacterized protein YqeY
VSCYLEAMRSVEEWKSVLRAALQGALRTRQAHAVAVIRETLAAIDNAEAAEASAAPPVQHGVIAGGVAGLGAGEVRRRILSAEAVTAIVEREIQERRDAATTFSALGRQDHASTLRLQIDVLVSLKKAGDLAQEPPLERGEGVGHPACAGARQV